MTLINETHDTAVRSWVTSANEPDTDFPIQNLPFGIFRRAGTTERFRGGVAIGDQILDLAALTLANPLTGRAAAALAAASGESLNELMALGPAHWSALRHALWTLLHAAQADTQVLEPIMHHSSNGCNVRPGDFMGTGTLSGPGASQSGSFLEVTLGGKRPFILPTGEERTFIADGDAVVMRAWCERGGAARIGFGVCEGVVAPART